MNPQEKRHAVHLMKYVWDKAQAEWTGNLASRNPMRRTFHGRARPLPECFGPYLRYAIDSDFRELLDGFSSTRKQVFDESFKLFLLVELKTAEIVQPVREGNERAR